ncbi:hypothetical protein R3I93_017513 [Phoxinus phoxinus]|uniref:Myb/SANT-like DNA-binding domain-containing protein n=1 Tax=Phoxinus phoxinus TaxID=58324 RepID=A0AAN9CJL4_9TELE
MAESDASVVNVYASDTMLYWDQEMTQPITQTLYQREGESTLYMDHDFTTALQIVPPVSVSETDENTTAELPQNQGFTRDQTLFLIDLMRQHLMKDDSELPRNLAELNSRIKMSRGKKRSFWQEIAAKLQSQFNQHFDVDKVSRKWTTLEDAYKKAVDNNASTGKAPTKFQFFKEMGELIGGHHDVDFPVIGTAKGVTVRRPEAFKQPLMFGNSSTEEELSSPSIAHSSDSESAGPSTLSPPHTSALARKRKRREDITQVMSRVIKECEEATQRRHEEIMGEIKTTNALFKQMLQQSHEQQ